VGGDWDRMVILLDRATVGTALAMVGERRGRLS
jgi:hypothetical protein